jgi:HSP20 family protein
MSKNFDPMKELGNIREQVNRVLEDTFNTHGSFAVDMYDDGDAIKIVTNPLPGLQVDTLDIAITDGQLTVSGVTENPLEGYNFIRQERKFGEFSRTIPLPGTVDADGAKAQFKHHVLTITIPKVAASRPHVVKIEPIEE